MDKLQGDSLLVIGNGFDLACGLKSRYQDFFEYRLKQYPNENLLNIEDIMSREKINDYMNEEHGLSDFENIRGLTVWDYYFRALGKLNDPDWYLVEKKIKEALISDNNGFANIINCLPNSDKKLTSFFHNRFKISVQVRNILNGIYDEVHTQLRSNLGYIRTIQSNFGVTPPRDYELDKKIEKLDYVMQNIVGDINVAEQWEWSDIKGRRSFLLAELKLFEKSFGFYIQQQILKETEYNQNVQEMLLEFMDTAEIKMIESFNYSSPNLEDVNVPIRHINGDCITPIFGIDSPTKTKFNLLFPFTKTSRRMELQFSEKYDSNRGDFNNLIVYGHSLNEQDYSYFFPVFDYLKISDATATSKVVFCYSNYSKNSKIETQKRINKLILAYSQYIHLEPNDMRLLDALTTMGRIKIREIKLPEENIGTKSQQSFNSPSDNPHNPISRIMS